MSSVPVVISQILMSLLRLPRASMRPSGESREADHVVVIACEEKLLRFAGIRVPQPYGTVFAGSGQRLAVRREEDGSDVRRVSPERAQEAPGFNVPHADEPVDSSAGESQPVRCKGHRPDSMRMAANVLKLPCPCLPVFEEVDWRGVCSRRCVGGGREQVGKQFGRP